MNCQSQPTTSIMAVPLHCTQRQQGQSLRKSRYVPRSFVQHNYHDRSNELPDCTPNVTRGGISTLFPQKLHAAIDRMAADGLGHICSWQPHGRAFVVRNPKEFESIMPRYFGKTKMASFQRQLNLYGFMRLTHGPDKGGYYHELFLQHRYYLSQKIQRCRVKGNGARSATNPDAEPNFYAMPPVAPTPQVAVVPQVVSPPPAMPAPAQSLAPTRPTLPRQVSLTERDLVQSVEPAQPAAVKEDSEELGKGFWNSMEMLMENMDNLDDEGLSSDELAELDNIIEPSPAVAMAPEIARTISLRPKEVLSTEATVLDNEVTEFLKVMFEKESTPSATKVQHIKGISMAGSANAVAYARPNGFRRRSMCNAAA